MTDQQQQINQLRELVQGMKLSIADNDTVEEAKNHVTLKATEGTYTLKDLQVNDVEMRNGEAIPLDEQGELVYDGNTPPRPALK